MFEPPKALLSQFACFGPGLAGAGDCQAGLSLRKRVARSADGRRPVYVCAAPSLRRRWSSSATANRSINCGMARSAVSWERSRRTALPWRVGGSAKGGPSGSGGAASASGGRGGSVSASTCDLARKAGASLSVAVSAGLNDWSDAAMRAAAKPTKPPINIAATAIMTSLLNTEGGNMSPKPCVSPVARPAGMTATDPPSSAANHRVTKGTNAGCRLSGAALLR